MNENENISQDTNIISDQQTNTSLHISNTEYNIGQQNEENEPEMMEIQFVLNNSIDQLEQIGFTQIQQIQNSNNDSRGSIEQNHTEIQEGSIEQNHTEIQEGSMEYNHTEIQELSNTGGQSLIQSVQNTLEYQSVQNTVEYQSVENTVEYQSIQNTVEYNTAEQMEIEQGPEQSIEQTQQLETEPCNSHQNNQTEIENQIMPCEFSYSLSEFKNDFDDKKDVDFNVVENQNKRHIFEKFSQLQGDEIVEQMLNWRCRRGRDDPFVKTIQVGDLVEWQRQKNCEHVPIKITQVQKNQRQILGQHRFTDEKFEDGIPFYELRPAYPWCSNLLDFQMNFQENQCVDCYDKEGGVWSVGKVVNCEKNEGSSMQIVEWQSENEVQEFVEVYDEIQCVAIQLFNGQFIEIKGDEISQVVRPALIRVQGQWGPYSHKIMEVYQEIQKKILEGDWH